MKPAHKIIIILPILFFLLSLVFLQKKQKSGIYKISSKTFLYELSKPDKQQKLDKELREISGLTNIDSLRLACIQDENGIIYIINKKTGKIEKKIRFGKNGDYEGLEIFGNNMWIIKSNGTLFEVQNYFSKTKRNTVKHRTILSPKNNIEGLALDNSSENLLIACKGYPLGNIKKGRKYKVVYRFNLKTKKLNPEPFLLINTDSVKKHEHYNTVTKWGIKMTTWLNLSNGDISFQPSGIAVHPENKDIYIIASVGKLLITISEKRNISAIVKLDKKIFPHPEGICFSPDGTLFISNEGADKKATLLKFSPKK